jgi:hypothetical protein
MNWRAFFSGVAGWLVVWVLLACIGFGLAAFTVPSGAEATREAPRFEPAGNVTVYVDPDTGCHYLRAGSSSLVPRWTADGRLLCLK